MRWRISETGDGRNLTIEITVEAGKVADLDMKGAAASHFGQELIDAAIAMVSCKGDNPRRQPREGEFK